MPRATSTAFVATLSMLTADVAAQESEALFHAPLAVLPIDSPPFQRLADFDGDGDLDAIGTRVHGLGGSNEIRIWTNDGTGAFTSAWAGAAPITMAVTYSPHQRTLVLATADFNSDGLADFVVAGANTAVRFVSTGNFTFTTSSVTSIIPLITGIATGDFDNDGSIDFAVAGVDFGSARAQAFLAAGGTPSLFLPYATTVGDMRIAAADLDGQPGTDLLAFNRDHQTARVLKVVSGQLSAVQILVSSIPTNLSTPWKWIAGDIDSDSDTDVVIFHPGEAGFTPAKYQIFRRTGPGTFTAENHRDGGPSEYLADIDGDGDLDGVCCGGGGGPFADWPKLDFQSMFQIAENRGGGDFAFSWDFRGAGSMSMAGTADIDGDGDVDFVAGRCVHYGRGPWTEQPMPAAAGSDTVRRHYIADSDRDGDPDLPWKRNRGDGTMTYFEEIVWPPLGTAYTGAWIRIDGDGDGAPDRIYRLVNTTGFESMVLVRNNGGGRYHYVGACAPLGLDFGGSLPDHYLAADCDGDGDEDVISRSNPLYGEGYFAQIFWNNGGTFSAGPSFTQANGGRIDAVADFDDDDLPDLLMSTASATSVLRGTGNAVAPFVSAWTGPGKPFEPNALAVADLDDDGRLDFAAAAATSLTLFVNYSQPGGPFGFADHTLNGVGVTLQTPSVVTPMPSTLAAADFDGDGKTDLVLGRAPGEPGVSTVLRRISWSNPPGLANYVVTKQVTNGGFASDANGDGDLDLIGDLATQNPMHHGSTAGRRTQSLPGVPGEGGATPVLGATGPFRGGDTMDLRLTSVPGPTLALLCISLGETLLIDQPLPGLTCYIDPATAVSGSWSITPNGQGRAAASASWPILVPPGLQGLAFYMQAFVLDLSAPTIGTQTNLLTIRFGS